jgi:hypothetical protein
LNLSYFGNGCRSGVKEERFKAVPGTGRRGTPKGNIFHKILKILKTFQPLRFAHGSVGTRLLNTRFHPENFFREMGTLNASPRKGNLASLKNPRFNSGCDTIKTVVRIH